MTPTQTSTERSLHGGLSHLAALEAESIFIMREVAAEFERPVVLFSGGKDSIILLRNRLQTVTLLDAIQEHGFDAVFGGGRRDEEKARAKERIYSFRDEFGQWEPRSQRPELWNLYNGRIRKGQHMRVFPISNWTEMDVWQYIQQEELEVPEIYFAHERDVFKRDGMWLSTGPHLHPRDNEPVTKMVVRYRTVGDMTCTGAVESHARTLDEIVIETAAARITERGATRADDAFSETSMEDRKREGYF
jgi:sulfate adenylyltransferase subunit 2